VYICQCYCYLITYFLQYSLYCKSPTYIQCSFVDNSAKLTDANEITPESNYVSIFENGTCLWEPRYELSVTQCPVDVKWFPFDRQVCDLEFESWLLHNTSLNLLMRIDSVIVKSFLPPDAWHLTGTFCWSTENAGTGKKYQSRSRHTYTHTHTHTHNRLAADCTFRGRS